MRMRGRRGDKDQPLMPVPAPARPRADQPCLDWPHCVLHCMCQFVWHFVTHLTLTQQKAMRACRLAQGGAGGGYSNGAEAWQGI